MFNKKYNIDDLYLVKIGLVKEKIIPNEKNWIYSQKELSLKGLSYACVKITKKNNKFVFTDVVNNYNYNLYGKNSKDGEICVSTKNIERLRRIFFLPQLKIVSDKILNKLLGELAKKPSERNSKELVREICELNKIKIVKNEELENSDKTL